MSHLFRFTVFVFVPVFFQAFGKGEMVSLGHKDFYPSPERPVGWRGDGTGRFPGATPPVEWDEGSRKGLAWKTPLEGFGYCTPILVGDRVFLTADPDVTLCLDGKSGKILWRTSAGLTQTPKHWHDQYGFSFPTPASDGKRVYVRFSTAVVCYGLDGKEFWRQSIIAGKDAFNCGSPVLAAGRLIVHMGGGGQNKHQPPVVGLNSNTGEKVWEVPDVDHGYYGVTSPVRIRMGNTDVILTANGQAIRASDGKALATGVGCLPGWHKGRTHNVVYDEVSSLFYTLVWKGAGAEQIWRGLSVKLSFDSLDKLKAEPVWGPLGPETSGWNKEKVGMPFTLYHNGIFYVQSSWMYALDGKDGKAGRMAKAIEKAGGTAYPEITLAGPYIFVGGQKGSVVIIEPGLQWKILRENRLADQIHNLGFFQGDRFYLRARKALYCLGGPAPAQDGPKPGLNR